MVMSKFNSMHGNGKDGCKYDGSGESSTSGRA